MGINNAGLWTICYTDVPNDTTVDDLSRHMSDIVAGNLFGSGDGGFSDALAEELLESDQADMFKMKLGDIMETEASAGADANATEAGAGDGDLSPDAIPADLKVTAPYKSALQEAAVKVIVDQTLEGFPLSSGCSKIGDVINQKSREEVFWSNVPYPYGEDSYYVFQCLRAFVCGFALFSLLACFWYLVTLGTPVGCCSSANMFFAMLFACLQVRPLFSPPHISPASLSPPASMLRETWKKAKWGRQKDGEHVPLEVEGSPQVKRTDILAVC